LASQSSISNGFQRLRLVHDRFPYSAMGRSTRRGPWLPEEDGTLLQLVHVQGPNNWVRISQHMQHRSPKQCRERYHQNLKPSLKHEPISPEEGEAIEQLVQDMGKRWAEIARRLGNRSDNAVKNWWNGSMNRRKRHTGPNSVISRGVGPRAHPLPASSPSQSIGPINPRFNFGDRHGLPAGVVSVNQQQTHEYESRLEKAGYLPPPTSLPPHLEAEYHHRSISLPQPLLPRPEPRGPPPTFDTRSAPPSVHNTPDPFSLRSFRGQPNRQEARPPLLESRHSFPSDWQPPHRHLQEAPIISPAATEFSTEPPFHQAPSLISDNQSHCSISPKTVSSPRPSLPAPIDTSTRMWKPDQSRDIYGQHIDGRLYAHDEGYVSALPPSGTTESSNARFPFDPPLPRSLSYSDLKSPTENRTPGATGWSPSERDSRMNVSRLLE
jgi:Myb-like DNA-binding protein FlbD